MDDRPHVGLGTIGDEQYLENILRDVGKYYRRALHEKPMEQLAEFHDSLKFDSKELTKLQLAARDPPGAMQKELCKTQEALAAATKALRELAEKSAKEHAIPSSANFGQTYATLHGKVEEMRSKLQEKSEQLAAAKHEIRNLEQLMKESSLEGERRAHEIKSLRHQLRVANDLAETRHNELLAIGRSYADLIGITNNLRTQLNIPPLVFNVEAARKRSRD